MTDIVISNTHSLCVRELAPRLKREYLCLQRPKITGRDTYIPIQPSWRMPLHICIHTTFFKPPQSSRALLFNEIYPFKSIYKVFVVDTQYRHCRCDLAFLYCAITVKKAINLANTHQFYLLNQTLRNESVMQRILFISDPDIKHLQHVWNTGSETRLDYF